METKQDPCQPTRHHRRCRSRGGSSRPENISIVARKYHEAWHVLTENRHPIDIARMLTEVYIDPEWMLIPVRRKHVD